MLARDQNMMTYTHIRDIHAHTKTNRSSGGDCIPSVRESHVLMLTTHASSRAKGYVDLDVTNDADAQVTRFYLCINMCLGNRCTADNLQAPEHTLSKKAPGTYIEEYA